MTYIQQIIQPPKRSHKGANGKVLIIGGSDLFHAASQWSFRAASRLVDMTFYSSVAENNEIIRDAKLFATDGVIVPRAELPAYLDEVDTILLGPGMRRDRPSRFRSDELDQLLVGDLDKNDWENDTAAVTAALLHSYRDKKWVIDAGALQILQPEWLKDHTDESFILTPHRTELGRLTEKLGTEWSHWWRTEFQPLLESIDTLCVEQSTLDSAPAEIWDKERATQLVPPETQQKLFDISKKLYGALFIVKGPVDWIWDEERLVLVSGGNAGMTKGGTGDALAGLIAGFWAKSPRFPATVVASWLNKQAGHALFEQQGMMFNTSDLVEMIPRVWGLRDDPLG